MRPPLCAQSIASWRCTATAAALGVRRHGCASIASVSLVRGASAEVVRDFVRYHRRIGVRAIMLFFDDPAETDARAAAEAVDGVTAVACDEAFWMRRLRTSTIVRHRSVLPVFEDVAAHWRTEVQSRQSLCVEAAAEVAAAANLEWLVHIDIDEAILPGTIPIGEYLAAFPASVEQVLLPNHEAQPQSASIERWMREVTTFKVNPSFVENSEQLSEVWEDVCEWRRRHLPTSTPRASYFSAYAGSKACVRLSAIPLPFDVHKFIVLAPPNDGAAAAGPQQRGNTPEACERSFPRNAAIRSPVTHVARLSSEPCLLHYANCGFNHWLRKYEILGDFGDAWWGRVPIRLPVHLASRDAVACRSARNTKVNCLSALSKPCGQVEAASLLYQQVIVGNDVGEHAVLRAWGLLVQIDFPRQVLRGELDGSTRL